MDEVDEKTKELQDLIDKVKEALDPILDDDKVETAFFMLRIKGNPGAISVDKGHFYDITRELAGVVRRNQGRIQQECSM